MPWALRVARLGPADLLADVPRLPAGGGVACLVLSVGAGINLAVVDASAAEGVLTSLVVVVVVPPPRASGSPRKW